MTNGHLFLDDLHVGLEFTSTEHALDVDQITVFAGQFDPQPFHLDDEAARATFFNGLAASGWHTMALTMRLMVESIPLGGGMIGAGAEISWPSTTRADDVLHVLSRIVEIKPSKTKPDRGIVFVESRTLNQHQELRQTVISKVLVFKRQEALSGT